MKISVRLFATLTDLVGRRELELELAPGATAAQVFERLKQQYPRLASYSRSLVFAVNQEYADAETALKEGDEVALLPPVSGGADRADIRNNDGKDDWIELSVPPIPVPAALEFVRGDLDGAVVTFQGVVRNHSRGRRVVRMDYSAYEEMAVKKLREIAREIRRQWEVHRLAIVHRTGTLQVGECSVLISISSPHRGDAFEACRFAIDTLKKIAPIWKKEHYEDGSAWIEIENPASPYVRSAP